MYPLPHDNLAFLEPNHQHDPSFVVHLIEPPTALTQLLPPEIIAILEEVQNATSIAYASKGRFDELIADRFDRLLLDRSMTTDAVEMKENIDPEANKSPTRPTKRGRSYSEPAFFHYQNQVNAERHYLIKEALVDWHNKVTRLERRICMLPLNEADDHMFRAWLDPLKREVTKWEVEAEDTNVPEFEDTIEEMTTQEPITKTGIVEAVVETEELLESVAMEKSDSGIGL